MLQACKEECKLHRSFKSRGGGGGALPLEAVPHLRGKNKKGVKITENKKGYLNCSDQSSSHVIIAYVERVDKIMQQLHWFSLDINVNKKLKWIKTQKCLKVIFTLKSKLLSMSCAAPFHSALKATFRMTEFKSTIGSLLICKSLRYMYKIWKQSWFRV